MAAKSWVWSYFAKDNQDKSKVVCLKCKEAGKDVMLAFHNLTSAMSNHLKFQHKMEQQGPQGAVTNFSIHAISPWASLKSMPTGR